MKEKIKNWMKEHKKLIKTGLYCFTIGALIGFVKGVLTESKILGSAYDRLPSRDDSSDEDYGLTEDNCDDPELLKLYHNDGEES